MGDDKGFGCVVVMIAVMAIVFFVALMVGKDYDNKLLTDRQKQIIENYKSPVEHTDAQRLDWLTAHPTRTPWTRYGTNVRREIDFMLDTEKGGD